MYIHAVGQVALMWAIALANREFPHCGLMLRIEAH